MGKIAIIYYSMYGHIRAMAEAVKAGVEEAGLEAVLLQIPETLPAEVLAKMGAPPKSDDPIANVATLTEYDGIIFGLSGRYGQAPAQFRAFWDATGQHWAKGTLIGKPAAVFSSTAQQGGGQETIGLTLIPQLAHHGMIFVPLGYRDPSMFNNDEIHGGSPYGAGTIANGDGSRMPSEVEKGMAKIQGKSFAQIAAKLAK
jgi:NAD(P)H dehydrogenase (quinone)